MVKSTSSPQFSILLPTHNRADVISYAIESVLHQTVPNFELLILGDGCTDETESIVTKFISQDNRIKWFPFPKGKGFGYGHRNTVLKQATGIYIAFAAHDDLWFPDHLATFLTFFQEYPDYSLAYTRPLWIHPDGTIIPSFFNTDDLQTKNILLNSHNEIPADCVVHTRQAMEEVGYCNANLPEAADWDLWKRIILKDPAQRIGFITTPTIVHFRANWRTENTSWDDHLKKFYEKVKETNTVPVELKIQMKESEPLQKILWDKVKDKEWLEKLRKYTITMVDARARDVVGLVHYNQHLHQEINNLQEGKAREVSQLNEKVNELLQDKQKLQLEQERKLVELMSENKRLTNDMKRMSSTKGYQLLEYVRTLLKAVRK